MQRLDDQKVPKNFSLANCCNLIQVLCWEKSCTESFPSHLCLWIVFAASISAGNWNLYFVRDFDLKGNGRWTFSNEQGMFNVCFLSAWHGVHSQLLRTLESSVWFFYFFSRRRKPMILFTKELQLIPKRLSCREQSALSSHAWASGQSLLVLFSRTSICFDSFAYRDQEKAWK